MRNKVDAVLACRVQGARLYGKPLQSLEPGGITVIESLLTHLDNIKSIDKIVLAIARGDENYGFVRLANRLGLPYYIGDENDVLDRMIKASLQENISHIFRITTEGPFVIWEYADQIIKEFLEGDFDWASYKDSPEGTGFELIKTEALINSHKYGTERNRSELVTSYICENQDQFKLLFKELPVELRRPEVRLTVDYAEDLVFCQQVYRELKKNGDHFSVSQIIKFWDNNPSVRKPIENIGLDWGTGRLAWTISDKEKAEQSK